MKRLLPLLAFIGIAFIGKAQPSDTYLQARMNAGKMPGANFVIIKNGKWVWSKSLGSADIAGNKTIDRQTIFMMASVSKTMIVTSIMQLWEQGRIDLDRDINYYLPFTVRTPIHPNDSITTRMLLTHTSAIQDEWNTLSALYVYGDSPITLDSFLRNYFVAGGSYYSATGNFYSYIPGTQYNYSNVASTLAAYLVERISGDKYSHYCDTAIFQKLCMDNTSLLLAGISDTTMIARPYYWNGSTYEDIGLYGYPDYPDGQLRTNITALARFMNMYMNQGNYNGTQVLQSATIDTILKRQTSADWSQGLIFYNAITSNGDTVWGHNGGDAGVNTAMYFNRQNKTGVIVLTNGDGTQVSNADLFVDTLYKYGLTITPNLNDTFPSCTITGVNDIATEAKDIRIYPNPTSGLITVNTPVNGTAILCDMQGRVVYECSLRRGENQEQLPSSLAQGMYLMRITDSNRTILKVTRITLLR
jgi:CubicO group peptidase (beta-lactamase class C family)